MRNFAYHNSFDADRKFSGAVMNAITKSGTNGFHGDVFEFLRNINLKQELFLSGKSELRRQFSFGFAAGGQSGKTSCSVLRLTRHKGSTRRRSDCERADRRQRRVSCCRL